MNNINNLGLLAIMKKKFIFILLAGVIGAVCVSSAKYMFSDIAQRHGDYLFIQTIQVESSDGNAIAKDDFDYKGFLESPSNYYSFIHTAEKGDFDFSKIDSAWGRKNAYERMDFLKQKIHVSYFRNNVFEVSMQFDANVTRDVDYMKEHAELLMNDFVSQSENSIQDVNPNAKFRLVNKESSVPVVEPINRKNIAIKFSIIGFIVGVFSSVICLFLWTVAKESRKNH